MSALPLTDPAFQKLRNMLGEAEANALSEEILRKLGLTAIVTPNDRLRFGNALVERGGLVAAIGGAIRVQAFLMGAKE